MQTKAQNGFKLVLANNHLNILTGIADLVYIYLNKGIKKKAKELVINTIKNIKTDTSKSYLNTLTSLNNIVLIYLNKEQLKKTETLGV
jgi:hypothetical protein